MSVAWPSLFLRPACATAAVTRPARRQPILQLFSGYRCTLKRDVSLPRGFAASTCTCTKNRSHARFSQCSIQRGFSTSQILPARTRPRIPRKEEQTDPDVYVGQTPEYAPAQTDANGPSVVGEDGKELTWRDFDPEGGMPLPNGDCSPEVIREIFSTDNIDAETGNYILRVMHWRRMSGALIDKWLEFPPESGVTTQQALQALQYVRTLLPDFDENAAGQTWAEEESLRLEADIKDKAVRLGIYKRDPDDVDFVLEEEQQQGTEEGRARSGESQLIKMRSANEAAWDQEQAEIARAEEEAERASLHAHRGPLELSGGVQPDTQMTTIDGTGILISSPRNKAWLQPVERKEWVKYYEDRAQLFQGSVVPQLSLSRRLGSGLAILIAVLGLGQFLADNYTTPPMSARLWPDVTPAVATLSGLSAALVLFFVAARLPPLWRAYSKYFTIVPAYPHGMSIVGAIFRNDSPGHLVFNLASLWLFGLMLHDDIGRGAYLSVFLSAGAAGGYISLVYNVLLRNWNTYIFGASGAILGTVGAACVLHPNGTLKLAGQEIPIAAWVFAALYMSREAFALIRRRKTDIDHAGHLGGLVAGMAMAGWWKWKGRHQPISDSQNRSIEDAQATC